MKKQILFKLIILLIILSFTNCKYERIPPGYAGVIIKRTTGLDTTKVLDEGSYLTGFFRKIEIYNIKEQQFSDSILDCKLKNRSTIELSYLFRFKPDKKHLPYLCRDFGEDYVNTYVIPSVRTMIRSTMGNYNLSEIVNEDVSSLLSNSLMDRDIWDNYIIPKAFVLYEIRYECIDKAAIEAGLQKTVEGLMSIKEETRMKSVKELFTDGSSTAYTILLNHWHKETSQRIKDYIIVEMSKTTEAN